MKIILNQDLSKVGRKYDLKEVAAGYARNFLLPRGFAKLATESAIRQTANLKQQAAETEKLQQALLDKTLIDLADQPVVIKAKANDTGQLFAGIGPAEIAAAISAKVGSVIPTEVIELTKPIKTIGEQLITLRLGAGSSQIKLKVEPIEETAKEH